MIRNLIFDFGNTLVRFDPQTMTRPYVPDPEDRELVCHAVFARDLWDRLDSGEYTESDLFPRIRERLPERLRDAGETVLRNWCRNLPDVDGMPELIRRMKARGLSLYLLSNISADFAERIGDFPILREMDGFVLSGVCGLVKPSAEIFRYLCEKYAILPQESVFIDDLPRNVEAARTLGFHTDCFDGNAERLERRLTELLTDRNT